MVVLIGEITRLEDGPAFFHASFWRDFYRSMLTQTVRSAITKLLILAVTIAIVPMARAASTQRVDLVIALDLTKSTDVKGPDGKTEFQKNVDGVAGVLVQVPAGSNITVIGITDRSFAQPYILLSATMPDDPGYFGERLTAAHSALTRIWRQRSAKLAPTFKGTDILGALELAGQIFNQQLSGGTHKVLVVFSDMRNHTPELDLETKNKSVHSLRSPSDIGPPFDLRDVQVFALGVDGAGSASEEWQRILAYWKQFFAAHTASVCAWSPLRSVSLVANR
jgi:hypothetical protein